MLNFLIFGVAMFFLGVGIGSSGAARSHRKAAIEAGFGKYVVKDPMALVPEIEFQWNPSIVKTEKPDLGSND